MGKIRPKLVGPDELTRFEPAEYPCQTPADPFCGTDDTDGPVEEELILSDRKRVFSPAQRSLVTEVINRIIPATDKLPGAGNLGIAASIEDAAASTPDLTRLFNDGLAQIAIAAGRDSGGGFESLSNTAKDDLLRSLEAANPVFFDQLVLQTYNGYYTNTEVFNLIGYTLPKPAPPGSQPELLDVSLLEQQRDREPFWKKV